MLKLPLGISDFKNLKERNFYYADKTMFIEKIENDADYMMILRPRRFGKSLFLSTLDYYYNINYKDKFDQIFKDTYIHKNPTSERGKYLILKLNFSGIETENVESTKESFVRTLRKRIETFIKSYKEYFEKEDIQRINEEKIPSELIKIIIERLQQSEKAPKLYVLIDEYDHFSNRIFTKDKKDFTKLIEPDGFLRPFFETIKIGTESVIKKVFITGVLPILLDSLTSGFNIIQNQSMDEEYNNLFGFEQRDVDYLLKEISAETHKELVKTYYNGYVFSTECLNQNNMIYNTDMILFFIYKYSKRNKLPKDLIDQNIITDYKKIEAIVKSANKEIEESIIEELVHKEEIYINQIQQSYSLTFASEDMFTRNSIVSLLYYIGYLTISESTPLKTTLKVPNYMMKILYYEYMKYLLERFVNIKMDNTKLYNSILDLGEGNIKPFIKTIEEYLEILSNRDYINFEEKYIKLAMTSMLVATTKGYQAISEREVKGRYIDLYIKGIYPNMKNYIIELKYTKKSESDKEKNEKLEEGKRQIKDIKEKTNLENTDYYVLLFEKDKCIEIYKE